MAQLARPDVTRAPALHSDELAARLVADTGAAAIIDPSGQLAPVLAVRPRAVRFRAADPVQRHGVNPFARPLRIHYGLAVRHVTMLHASYLGRITVAEWRALRALCATLLAYPGAGILDLWRVDADPLFRREAVGRLPEGASRHWWRATEAAGLGRRRAQLTALLDRLSALIERPEMYATLAHRRSFNFRALVERGHPFAADLAGLPPRESAYLGGLLTWRLYLAAVVAGGSTSYRLYAPQPALRAAGLGQGAALAHRRGLEIVAFDDG